MKAMLVTEKVCKGCSTFGKGWDNSVVGVYQKCYRPGRPMSDEGVFRMHAGKWVPRDCPRYLEHLVLRQNEIGA